MQQSNLPGSALLLSSHKLTARHELQQLSVCRPPASRSTGNWERGKNMPASLSFALMLPFLSPPFTLTLWVLPLSFSLSFLSTASVFYWLQGSKATIKFNPKLHLQTQAVTYAVILDTAWDYQRDIYSRADGMTGVVARALSPSVDRLLMTTAFGRSVQQACYCAHTSRLSELTGPKHSQTLFTAQRRKKMSQKTTLFTSF